MKKKSMCFHLPDKEKSELEIYANIEGVSQTQIIRSALNLYIKHLKKTSPCPACGSIKETKP